MWVFDIESLGVDFKNPAWVLDNKPKKITCISAINRETGEEREWRHENEGEIEEGLRFLMDKDLGGHNIHGFDIPYIQRLHPWWKPTGFIRDSKTESEMWYPSKDLKSKDFAAEKRYGKWISKHLYGRHSMEAWGARLGEPKDDFAKRMKELGLDPWSDELPEPYATERVKYCTQDTRVNVKLFDFLEKKFDYTAGALAVRIENRVAQILVRQQQWGVRFFRDRAIALHQDLVAKQHELYTELQQTFAPFYLRDGKGQVPKRTMKRFVENPSGSKTRKYKGRVQVGWYEEVEEGNTFVKIKLTEFNPNSRAHIAHRLMRLYGWKPVEFSKKTGAPKVDEKVLKDLRYPTVPLLLEYMLICKRVGQVADGDQAWLKVERDGRVHGMVSQNGTRTTRASHHSPNMGQIPKVSKPYGPQCRACFGASEGRKQVGVDLSGIELRGLGHYLGRYDGGAYARNVIEGDVHEDAKVACKFNLRDNVKTLEYAFLYGAFDFKLGLTVMDDMTPEQREEFGKATTKRVTALGAQARSRLQKGINGLEPLVKACHKAARKKRARGLDGRMLFVPSMHSSLNTVLQALGGTLAKVWMVLVDDALIEAGINPALSWIATDDYGAIQILFVHDELQFDVKPELTEQVSKVSEEAATKAGELLNLRVRVDAEAKVGMDWSECH